MSLYGIQKFLYDLNRDSKMQTRYTNERTQLLSEYTLLDDERAAIDQGDIGLIYVMGANGQLLLHFAAFLGMPWPEYIASMRAGVEKHGPVRAGVYAMTTTINQKVAGV